MKYNKIKLALASLAIFSLFFFSNVDAQACPDSSWDGMFTGTKSYAPDCWVEFDYCTRYQSGLNTIDIYISAIRYCGACAGTLSQEFDNAPMVVFEDLVGYIATNNNIYGTPIIPPCPQQSTRVWKLGTSSCWTTLWVEYLAMRDGVLRTIREKAACNDFEEYFCWNSYTICMGYDEDGNYVPMTTLTHTGGNVNYDCGENCEHICE